MRVCPVCRAELNDFDSICEYCGTELPVNIEFESCLTKAETIFNLFERISKDSYKLTKADLVVTIIDSKTGETRKKTISDVSIDSKEKIVKLDKMTDGDIIELKLINVKSEDTIIKGITASDKFIY